ncbi:MAG: N-acetylmuramoyl-L-alanine amidase [Armatimonadota bacterium]
MTRPDRVVIDPGHPSEVGEGCRGRRTDEITVAWEIAKLLRDALRASGCDVLLTKRTARERVTNRSRAAIATRFRADLAVRLHCDAGADRGFAVYAPDRPGRDRNGNRGPSATVCARSTFAARQFHTAMGSALAALLPDRGCWSDTKTAIGAEQGALTGSVHSTQPVVLVEMVVLTQTTDEGFILSPAGRRRMVDALAAGTRAALGALRPRD